MNYLTESVNALKMTGLQKANLIEQIGERFNAQKMSNSSNKNPHAKSKNETLLRQMALESGLSVDNVVKIILPR